MSCDLYKHDHYISHQLPYIFNREIIEYDMRDGGFSVSKEYNLLTESEIEKYEKYRKQTRTVELGKKQRKDKIYTEGLKDGFMKARKAFFEANEINIEDVISIKKDAIFIARAGGCKYTKVGKYIEFREKHSYSSYIQLPRNLEIYYSPNGTDVKGISDEKIQAHKDYCISFINDFCNKMETNKPYQVLGFLRRFSDKYKRRELPVGYYREFNVMSKFRAMDGTEFDEYWEDGAEDLNITYNFFNLIIKLIQIPL